jgi:hypothetical protein
MTTVGRPFRFWVNDDEDSGEAGDSGERDVDGTYGFRYVQEPRGGLEKRRYLRSNSQSTGYVDGGRDLVDFFPVSLDIQQVLAVFPPDARTKYKLKHAEGALNFTYTDLARDKANDYLERVLDSGFGLDASQAARNATTWQITAEGVELSPEFLKKEGFSAGGVILVECRSATDKPLVLVVEKDGVVIVELSAVLKICAVEEMYRHADLTGLAKEYDGGSIAPPQPPKPTNMGQPTGLPDSETIDKYFVFVHGYNVNAYHARGWNAEVFKRLYALGSRARFIGVTWNGDTRLDYHKAVFHAFQAGDGLRAALGLPAGADVTVAAHSLGNMLVSHAIQSGGFHPKNYFMINAAVPLEAYDPSVLEQKGPGSAYEVMTEDSWKGKDPRSFASNWHGLFDSEEDSRAKLTWKGLFNEVKSKSRVINFYSPGEDVVENPRSSSSKIIEDMIRNWDTSKGAWGHQEMIKGGGALGGLAFSRVQGGWRLWDTSDVLASTSESELRKSPRFFPFIEGDLFSEDVATGSNRAAELRVAYDVLARGIPAMSYGAAANEISAMAQNDGNFNMELDGRNFGLWPTEGHGEEFRAGRWIHSDFKNVALPYVCKMYQSMITKGDLHFP